MEFHEEIEEINAVADRIRHEGAMRRMDVPELIRNIDKAKSKTKKANSKTKKANKQFGNPISSLDI